jgi:antibiotic biosynthesis monooxygenase (ABM) superfamily enzyme
MQHEGKALAADETNGHHQRTPGIASVHVRAALTWCAIFPLIVIGTTVEGLFTQTWHPVLRTLVLTLVVVPLSVYLVVPRLLLLHSRLSHAAHRRRNRRAERRSARRDAHAA